jgi:hypothetical protein
MKWCGRHFAGLEAAPSDTCLPHRDLRHQGNAGAGRDHHPQGFQAGGAEAQRLMPAVAAVAGRRQGCRRYDYTADAE